MAETYNCKDVIDTCKYKFTTHYSNFKGCDYLCKTGKRIGCKPEQCDKYVDRRLKHESKRDN